MIDFTQKQEINIGDSIILFGGDVGFLQRNFKKDTIEAYVEDIFFIKMKGWNGILNLNHDKFDKDSTSLTMSLYYFNSKVGYYPTGLTVWGKKITSDDYLKDRDPEDGLDIENIFLESNMGFNKIN